MTQRRQKLAIACSFQERNGGQFPCTSQIYLHIDADFSLLVRLRTLVLLVFIFSAILLTSFSKSNTIWPRSAQLKCFDEIYNFQLKLSTSFGQGNMNYITDNEEEESVAKWNPVGFYYRLLIPLRFNFNVAHGVLGHYTLYRFNNSYQFLRDDPRRLLIQFHIKTSLLHPYYRRMAVLEKKSIVF